MMLFSPCTFPPYDKRKPQKEDEMDYFVDVVHPRQLRLGHGYQAESENYQTQHKCESITEEKTEHKKRIRQKTKRTRPPLAVKTRSGLKIVLRLIRLSAVRTFDVGNDVALLNV